MEFQTVCVLGLGYIGLPTASTFATHGMQVIGVDVNQRVVEVLRDGETHIQEPGLRTLVQAAFKSNRLKVSSVPETADAFVIAVPTPILADKRADMQYVEAAARSILPHLRPGNLVVLESTSPPRTTLDLLAPILEQRRTDCWRGLLPGVHCRTRPARQDPPRVDRERPGGWRHRSRLGRSGARSLCNLCAG